MRASERTCDRESQQLSRVLATKQTCAEVFFIELDFFFKKKEDGADESLLLLRGLPLQSASHVQESHSNS